MARSVAKSLIQHKEFSATDLARRFAEEYFREPGRGYGGSVATVFHALRETNYEDVYRPAAGQFEGQGSYGNGGAMRIAPAALFACAKKYDFSKIAELTEQITRLTHSHRQAIQGSILQCYMVNQCLLSSHPLPVDALMDSLIDTMKKLEGEESEDQKNKPAEASCERMEEDTNSEDRVEAGEATDEKSPGEPTLKTYWQKLNIVREFVKRDTQPSVEEVTKQLGVYIAALDSVPAALYCFLRALNEIDGLEGRNGFERTIMYSISHGGDTDTVASMAGALAGAYYGLEMIPSSWQQSCEGVEEAKRDAALLYGLGEKHGVDIDSKI
ncbi:ADP-ribosylhydrolase ARH3-like isoform X2 [Dreissena polymorpha]|nr:ADP-ribosylhydrolase ARH3-like isoform X2 [Dreissena polymorpha]XP_052226763.1 ADP-ribosylhydrolase ARH3-like isoform X2 [Dreissena polymorpha]